LSISTFKTSAFPDVKDVRSARFYETSGVKWKDGIDAGWMMQKAEIEWSDSQLWGWRDTGMTTNRYFRVWADGLTSQHCQT
jgi:hypothetical protein